MNFIYGILWMFVGISTHILFDFTHDSNLKNWRVVNDGVMGGRSQGEFFIDKNGHGVFKGTVSLDNYGGFTSVRYDFSKLTVTPTSTITIRLKGDGKNYQFRVKANRQEPYAYITTFSTTGKWQDVVIPLKMLYPSYRGKKLDMPNFSSNCIEEITFLIANKKAESFQLVLDEILVN